MTFLLDTNLLLWTTGKSQRLPAEAIALLEDQSNEFVFSAVNIWEIAIKASLGRRDFPTDPTMVRRSLLAHGYGELPLTGEHAIVVARLPFLHKDPFDRILVAQSIAEGVTLLTTDSLVAQYPCPVRLV